MIWTRMDHFHLETGVHFNLIAPPPSPDPGQPPRAGPSESPPWPHTHSTPKAEYYDDRRTSCPCQCPPVIAAGLLVPA